jgi:multidrug efflux pump subunit AcrA (membrane-fusion protein)
MSDRWLFAGAALPMLAGLALVALLQRPPAAALAASRTAPLPSADAEPDALAPSAWIGVVVAGNTAELAADAAGRVAEVYVANGARVARGDKLLQFDPADSATAVGFASAELGQRRSELSRAEARSEAAQLKLSRLREGAAWLSKDELEAALSESRVAEAELRSARAGVGMGRAQVSQQQLRRERKTLIAPFAGTVVTLDVDPGDSVVAGQIVLRISSDDRQVRFALPPDEPTPERVAITLQGTALSVEGEVASLRPEIDPSAQLVFATAALPVQLPEPTRWIPGAPIQVTRAPAPQRSEQH